ncbi:MAG TPA: DUF3489 domain-containing protein [Tianweitania sediminis]|jgi:hypothetical protein|nr:DUF3489 domain-containing protein [Tianweitania sediminis]
MNEHLGNSEEFDPTNAGTGETATCEAVLAASAKSSTSAGSKTEIVIKRLRRARGVTVADVMKMTGWQAHSVRGFLSGTVRKKLGLPLVSEPGKDGVRRYRITSTDV